MRPWTHSRRFRSAGSSRTSASTGALEPQERARRLAVLFALDGRDVRRVHGAAVGARPRCQHQLSGRPSAPPAGDRRDRVPVASSNGAARHRDGRGRIRPVRRPDPASTKSVRRTSKPTVGGSNPPGGARNQRVVGRFAKWRGSRHRSHGRVNLSSPWDHAQSGSGP